MVHASLEDRLRDIVEAVELIGRFVADKTYADYAGEALVRYAVERALLIVAEASQHVPEPLKATHPEVPWRDVRAIGNIIRHAYDRIDDRTIWRIVQEDLPALRAAARAMLEGLD
jgi:uncharacterized protein with HEPN domain